MFNRETMGRIARAEISVYDAMMAEIYAERDGEKAKVRNRRKNDRKHKLTPKMRKEQEELRNTNICNRYIGWGWTLIDDKKTMEQEQVARADWEIESAEIELDAEIMVWMRKIESERLTHINDWLQYA